MVALLPKEIFKLVRLIEFSIVRNYFGNTLYSNGVQTKKLVLNGYAGRRLINQFLSFSFRHEENRLKGNKMASKNINDFFTKCLESGRIGNQLEITESNVRRLGISYLSQGEYQKAIEYFEKGLEISTAIGDREGIATNTGNLGTAYLNLGEYQKAIEYFEKGLEISTAIGDRSGIATNTGNLGTAYLNLGEYQKAIEYFEKGLEISTAIGDREGIATNTGNLGTAYLNLGEYQKAIEYFEKGLEISTAIGDRSGIATKTGNLGTAYLDLGEYQKAIEYFEKGLEISTAIGDREGIATNTGNLGTAYLNLGEYQKAIEYFEKGLEISTAIGDRSGIATKTGNLGTAYLNLGEYQKAIEYFEKGLEISTAIGDREGIATNTGNLGTAYLNLGEYQKAIEYFEKGLEISTAIGDRSGIATKTGNLGTAYLNLGEYQKAIEYFEKGLEISTAIGDREGIATNTGNLGTAYLNLGEYQKAIEYFEKGLEISTAIGDREGIATNTGNLGTAYKRLGEYQKAIEYFEKGLEISTAIGDRSGIAILSCGLGDAYLSFGMHQDALLNLMKSIRLFDRLFLRMVPDENKLAFAKQYFFAHRVSMTCFLSIECIGSALLVNDLGRGKELHFCIDKHKKIVDEEVVEYADATLNRIEARDEQTEIQEIQKILDGGRNNTSILVFAFDVKKFLHIWVLNDECICNKSGTRLETLLLIRELVGKKNVSVNRDSSFFKLDSVGSNNNQIIFPLGMRYQKYAAKSAIENATINSNLTNREILQQLFMLLFYPVKDYVQGNKLIIVPDEHLFFAPFSSLVDENGCYLSHSYSTQITPSLHTLKSSMQRPYDSNIGFALFVGNPTGDLPSAAEEVECLSKLFDACPLIGPAAKKEALLQLLSEASIIHIAAHGEPNRGEIMLAPNCPPAQLGLSFTKPESYVLTQRDITNKSLQARLVVLCCCHTGRGEISSEGVIGITRAFLAAGARSVLAALWPIDDDATKVFMEKFYKELCKEISVCEALRRTMNDFQKHEQEEFRAIRIWAPFAIYGEDVKFQKDEIEKIREKSRKMFSGFVVLP